MPHQVGLTLHHSAPSKHGQQDGGENSKTILYYGQSGPQCCTLNLWGLAFGYPPPYLLLEYRLQESRGFICVFRIVFPVYRTTDIS